MKKKHIYKTIELWEGSSEHWKQLWSIIDTILENYDEIANRNDGLYLPYEFFSTLTQREKIQLYLIGEQWLITVHIVGYSGAIEGPSFSYTLNEKGYLDR